MSSNPLTEFADTLRELAKHRETWGEMAAAVSDFPLALEDAALLINDNCVIGLRSMWARRVATPVMHAYWHIQKCSIQRGHATKDDALVAIEILEQCTDTALRDRCIKYVEGAYNVTRNPAASRTARPMCHH